ncbi:uncharacterized protein LAESUDRAFT_710796 [Laetiporus sulphureus 93-53]|uniref:Uncharacterized protein n=1 Tax=Laetiporus sulphureus 93-53 TaxID=1314785 RepID=A0A165H415_9APHY|nr:uncharacterized protein LAESUDRAFT_710796 [Laetiporus sulphureus 93-53]KZT11212.1 hypothetical protein LAESUDRAFT_710796 [Laetiporus sulphureus 93-53]
MVRRKLHIPADLQHPGWSSNPLPAHTSSDHDIPDVQPDSNDIVRLFSGVPGSRSATCSAGFFLKTPDGAFDVILTAAYNLVNAAGKILPKLTAIIRGEKHTVSKQNVRVSNAYINGERTPDTNYGVILRPRSSNMAARGGFGFSMTLGSNESAPAELRISGCGAADAADTVTTSTSRCTSCHARHLEYPALAENERSMSGSPVWVSRQGYPTVLAIHNDATDDNGVHRGTRITPDLLKDVFLWASLGDYGRRIRAYTPKEKRAGPATLLERGLYLSFRKNMDFARVRLGTGTQFNVLPAEVAPGKDLYVLEIAGAQPGRRWVEFIPAKSEAVLTDQVKDACLFRIVRQEDRARIVVQQDGSAMQLRMQYTRIKEADGEDAESSEVSFVPLEGHDSDAVSHRIPIRKR